MVAVADGKKEEKKPDKDDKTYTYGGTDKSGTFSFDYTKYTTPEPWTNEGG